MFLQKPTESKCTFCRQSTGFMTVQEFREVFYKLKYSTDPLLIGKKVKESFDYIGYKYANNEDADMSEKYKGIPWKKRSGVHITKKKDGTYIFIPTLRLTVYGPEFIEYDCVKKTYSNGITDKELKDEIFESLVISELLYKKHDENYHHDIFFAYAEQLALERNRK